jgi:hypothetical protein
MADQRRETEHRPSPDALLEAARREDRRLGKLRIFVGAAPGVGKTYEMLQQAHALKKDGYDVVIGIVETHGRRETEALLEGLEVIPRKRIEYKGQFLQEMDLDAVIPSATSMSKSCAATASTSIPPSISSTSKASTTSSRKSPMCAFAKPCPTPCSTAPTPSRSST